MEIRGGGHPKTFLKSIWLGRGEWERFLNPGIFALLWKKRPQVLIGFSLNPSVIIALVMGKILGYRTAVFADTWLGRDEGISAGQKLVRKLIYTWFADAYLGASRQTLNMYRHYNKNVKNESLFLSSLCADNDLFNDTLRGANIEKKYDIMFAGRIVELKNPCFFAEVALKIKARRGHCSALIIGDGEEKVKQQLFQCLDKGGIDYYYAGFVAQSDLPLYYAKARILLLPTARDCWGVVINEAFVSGVPVITTPRTAAAGELVIDGKNGHVLAMDSELWAEKIQLLLENQDLLEEYTDNAMAAVKEFTFKKASKGIVSAIRYLEDGKK